MENLMNNLPQTTNKGEVAIYQPNDSIQMEVIMDQETVWLSQTQMVELFETTKQNVSLHIQNIFKERELERIATVKDYLIVQNEGKRQVQRVVSYYNLDVIISVGYRVKSHRGTQFRQWAIRVLKDYLLKGYAINQRFEHIERKVFEHDKQIETLVQQALPPKQGVFFDDQIFDAYVFVSDLIKLAEKSIVLIDNYVDESVLLLLSKRDKNVSAKILTSNLNATLKQDLSKHNAQYLPIEIDVFTKSHDRFLIIDDTQVFHIGASLKDLGKKWFAFSKIESEWLLNALPPLV